VTTTWQWCRSRPGRLTAVVCSGRNRPQNSNGQSEPMPSERRSQAAATKPEQQLDSGVVERGEAELVADDQVVAEQRVDYLADGVVG
jgi:hypothetical protein